MKKVDLEELMTVTEVAKVLKVSRCTVDRLIRLPNPKLGSLLIGGSRRIPLSSIKDFIQRGMSPTA